MKHYVVLLDRTRMFEGWDGELRIPKFEHVWVEHPDTPPGECIHHLWRATLGVTHTSPVRAADLEECLKLRLLVVTGPDPACVDQAACAARGITVAHLPAAGRSPQDHADALLDLLENSSPINGLRV